MKKTELTIETLVLVAVWDSPFIFQGCFKITELSEETPVLYFFRCQSNHQKQMDILNNDFSQTDYEFTHLYNDLGLIQFNTQEQAQEDALYVLKYALHRTLGEMLSRKSLQFTSIDDMAMQSFINQITPILSGDATLPAADHIGFAVAMDFCPTEETGVLAASVLLAKLSNQLKKH